MKNIISFLTILFCLSGCDNHTKHEAEELQIKQLTIDSLNSLVIQQHIIDSMKAATASRNIINREVANNSLITQ